MFLSLAAIVLMNTAPSTALRPETSRAVADSSVAGHWEAQLKGETKVFIIDFHFIVTKDTLTGTVDAPWLDQSFPITDGHIEGADITFTAFGSWHGQLVGDELRLTRELDYGKKQQMVAHRKAS